jgi:hypothetical protein
VWGLAICLRLVLRGLLTGVFCLGVLTGEGGKMEVRFLVVVGLIAFLGLALSLGFALEGVLGVCAFLAVMT